MTCTSIDSDIHYVLSAGLLDFNVLELDVSLLCPGRRDSSCAHWDHTVQLFICCNHLSPYCNMELGRWITAFRRSHVYAKHSKHTNTKGHKFHVDNPQPRAFIIWCENRVILPDVYSTEGLDVG